ncbi:MAG: hypothetical protein N2652_06435 [Kiritimatiellae bacterium]|nr:hypothetical protein [Kiritimatiellia bacterium]
MTESQKTDIERGGVGGGGGGRGVTESQETDIERGEPYRRTMLY